jgi:hypothetical protein
MDFEAYLSPKDCTTTTASLVAVDSQENSLLIIFAGDESL